MLGYNFCDATGLCPRKAVIRGLEFDQGLRHKQSALRYLRSSNLEESTRTANISDTITIWWISEPNETCAAILP